MTNDGREKIYREKTFWREKRTGRRLFCESNGYPLCQPERRPFIFDCAKKALSLVELSKFLIGSSVLSKLKSLHCIALLNDVKLKSFHYRNLTSLSNAMQCDDFAQNT